MPEDNEPDWGNISEELAAGIRPYAAYWALSKDRLVNELGALREFEAALARDGRLFFRNARHRGEGNDPPDCEADDLQGGRIGVELTEFVDGESIAVARNGEEPSWKYWTTENLAPRLEKIIQDKNKKLLRAKGGHDAHVLVIYTDEDFTLDSISEHVFSVASTIDRAFLLMSYDPYVEGCPCVELRLADTV